MGFQALAGNGESHDEGTGTMTVEMKGLAVETNVIN